jgi:hypothetical protein
MFCWQPVMTHTQTHTLLYTHTHTVRWTYIDTRTQYGRHTQTHTHSTVTPHVLLAACTAAGCLVLVIRHLYMVMVKGMVLCRRLLLGSDYTPSLYVCVCVCVCVCAGCLILIIRHLYI